MSSSSSSSSSSFLVSFCILAVLAACLMLGEGSPVVSVAHPGRLTLEEKQARAAVCLQEKETNRENNNASYPATFSIAESIPVGVNLTANLTTADALIALVNQAQCTIDIGVFYITLLGGDSPGTDLFNALVAATKRKVYLRIAISIPNPPFTDDDLVPLWGECDPDYLDVKFVDMPTFLGSGVQHSKFWIGDNEHFYVGSANVDWRSLTQVKELGIVVESKLLAEDLEKIFGVLWIAGNSSSLPPAWPSSVETHYNNVKPAYVEFAGEASSPVYLTTAPSMFCPPERTYDLEAIQSILADPATTQFDLEVMDYLPLEIYNGDPDYWPGIDDAIRSAAFRNVSVRMLISNWTYSDARMLQYLRSLNELDFIEVKRMNFPQPDPYIPFTQVNHAKFFVTNNQAFITTSNWVGDYFTNTFGVSFVSKSPSIQSALMSIFERDWYSQYSEWVS